MRALVPRAVADPFMTSELAEALGRPRWLAQKMTYCLRNMDAITQVGRQGNAILYARSSA